jgi:hypothetical protein
MEERGEVGYHGRMRTSRGTAATALSAVALAAAPALAFTPSGEERLELPLEWESEPPVFETRFVGAAPVARDAASAAGWFVQTHPRTGVVHFAWGGDALAANGIVRESEAVDAAREFLLSRGDVLGVRPDNLVLLLAKQGRGKWVARFAQTVDGTRVWRGTAFVLLGESGRVIAWGSDFFPEEAEAPSRAALSSGDAVTAAAASLGAAPRADRPIETEAWWVPARRGEGFALVPAWRLIFETDEPFGRWETFVDGESGGILARRNLYHRVNVIGTVEADVQNQPPTYGWCDGSVIDPLEHLTVSVAGGNSDDTDAAGSFVIPHGGFGAVTISAELRGPFSDVDRFAGLGPDASFSGNAIPGIGTTIAWDGSNSRQDERTTFWHANRVHDFMTALDPTFTELDYAMPSTIGRTDGFCPGNAWWDGTGMNYCEENVGANRANTGELGDVIYHEFGHGVTQEVYARNGAPEPVGDLHEGNSDILSNFLDRNSPVGLGFFLSTCASGIRDADNSLQWPQDNNGGHFGGQIIAGFHWDAWQSMLAALPQAEADQTAWSTWHFARDMGLPQSQPDQVLWTFLMDDDDEFLNNGTPHHEHFCLAAQNHGFACPAVVPLLVEHETLPHTEDGSSGFTVQASATPFFGGTIDQGSAEISWRVNGGAFVDVPMAAIGGNQFEGTIPPIAAGEVEYFITIANTGGSTGTSPIDAPASLHGFDVATIYEDFESGDPTGWTVVGSADRGHWELVDPIGTTVQPEDDATPDPGVFCWVTGQCDGPNCPNGCTTGCNDVDNGVTRLRSSVFPLAGATGVVIKYDRWFSGDEDPFEVDVSNDGGTTWTNVETTTEPGLAWTSHRIDVDALFGSADQVMVRFVARDGPLSPSTVEAGVDELRILASGVATGTPHAGVAAAPVAFGLEQNRPNPFRPDTEIAWSIPASGDVNLAVYDVSGRAVRRLAEGRWPAGRHTVTWDGADSSGRRVAAGIYFYRLVADERVLTRKMTVLK